ncbi:MAG TPA: hypothetical protein DCZ08_04445 [Anaerolineaceae bacterium]|nr:hypothetical protein [Anaerolineaceae bacterium]
MSLLTANDLAKSFGPVDIFSDVTLSIPHRARIGLVGPNGVGKTTLLRILLGEEEPSAGEVQVSRGLQMAYLPQEARLLTDRTLWQECLTVFEDLIQRQAELARLETAMANPEQGGIGAGFVRPAAGRVREVGRLHLRDPHPSDAHRPGV